MDSKDGYSKACCTIPPVVAAVEYVPRGEYEEIGGLKTYVTGSKTAKKALLVIYDIFGFFPQTIQGADILACHGRGTDTNRDGEEYAVFMPDWFEGSPASLAWYPPDTEEKMKAMGTWYTAKRTPNTVVERIPSLLEEIEKLVGTKEWGIYCWGGKVVSLISSDPSPFFKVGVQCHPGLIEPADAEKINIPMMILASMDEPADKVEEYEARLKGEKFVEVFGTSIHGWMSARGDLEDESSTSELHRQLTVTTSSNKKRRLSPPHTRGQPTDSSSDIPLESVEGYDSPARNDDIPQFDLPTTSPSTTAFPSNLPAHLQNSSTLSTTDCTSSAASSPSALYAGLSIEGGEPSGSELGTASFASIDQDIRGQSPLRSFSHRAIMGSGADASQRSSSPLKRPASELEPEATSSLQEDVDMVPVSQLDAADAKEGPGSSPLANRAQSVDMLDSTEHATSQTEDTAPRRRSTDVPPIDYQIKTVTTFAEALTESPIKENDKVYLVSKRWLDRVLARSSEALKNSKSEPEGEIGPIDNSDIIQQIIKDGDGEDFVQLKHGLGLESFHMFPESAWEFIVAWYGLMPGSLPIIRTAHNTNPDKNGIENMQFEFHPPVFTIHRLWSQNTPSNPRALKASNPPAPVYMVSQSMRYHDFLKKIKKKAEIDFSKRVRVWRVPRQQPAAEPTATAAADTATPPDSRPGTPAGPTIELSERAPQDRWNDLLLDVESFLKLTKGIDREVLEMRDTTNDKKYNGNLDLAMAGLGEDQSIVLDEHISGDDFISNYTTKTSKTSTSSSLSKPAGTGITNQVNSRVNSGRNSPAPAPGPVTRGRTQRSGRTVGCVGLSNLGNTCYMNSALQCVRSVEELTKYFLSGTAAEELNTDNPLGNNGQVALSYESLLREMYREPVPQSVAPRQFKTTIGRYAPQFSGYGQQDSQEFLGFLLDGLQEDLSRVKKKPYIEKPDSTDEMVNNDELIREMAAKVWDITKKRDDSVIADLFTGMYKSTLVCPVCDKVSITFDPFNNLTLQLPIENTWTHEVVFFPLNDRPVKLQVDMDKHASIKALKEFVSKRVDVPVSKLFCVEEFRGRIYKLHDDFKSVSDEINSSDVCMLYELEAEPTNWPAAKKTNKNKKKKFNSSYDSDEQDIVPHWDNPAAERMIVPVIHRKFNGNERSRGTKPYTFTLVSHTVMLTPAEARSEEMIRKKVLEKVKTLTTRWFDWDDNESAASASESTDHDLVLTTGSDADSSGGNKVVAHSVDGEEGLVDVTMKEQDDGQDPKTAAAKPEKQTPESRFNRQRPKFIEEGAFLAPEAQNLFTMSYYSGKGELVPVGWQVVTEDHPFPPLSSRMPSPSAESESGSGEDHEMTTGRASETSDEDDTLNSNPVSTTRMTEESSDEDELARSINNVPIRPKTPSRVQIVGGQRRQRRSMKTYSRKNRSKPAPRFANHDGNDEDLPASQDTVDEGPLIRLGEGIVVDWNLDAWDMLFNADSSDDTMRGQPTFETSRMSTLVDEELLNKRRIRQARKKNGITLEDCLNEFGKEEILSEQDTWYCPRCKEHRRASKKFELWKTPDILVMHLKRFSSSAMRRDKLDVFVDFPIEGLDLTSRVIEKADGKAEIYDLIAVDDHWGGLGGGHYTAFAKNFNDDQWYEYNDSSVSKTEKNIVSSSAYLLFYRRRSDVPLGGPRFKAIVEHGQADTSDEEDATESGEDRGLVGNSSLHGSSRALTGVGVAHQQTNHGSSGAATKTINPADLDFKASAAPPSYGDLEHDDGAPLLQPDMLMNDGTLQNSIEDAEDEGIDMHNSPPYDNNSSLLFNSNAWSFSSLNHNGRGPLPSGTGSDAEDSTIFSQEGRSDIVEDNSSSGSQERHDRFNDFETIEAAGDNGEPFEDQSPVPDAPDDGRVDLYDMAKDVLQVKKNKLFLPTEFKIPADATDMEEEQEEPATEIHVEDGEFKLD
ncbi:hypothetical protein BP5796_10119 [Coleophoma crateriformis]|uniref:ubiquitinyl hydrolase 1 n=1 Tax=Coleophoma crateriformis TaxID=565419 RepID=A0A3D8QUH9_9HELO|nr:hypothetical protein BP5796_10119 [Coleophoma crateriformis]